MLGRCVGDGGECDDGVGGDIFCVIMMVVVVVKILNIGDDGDEDLMMVVNMIKNGIGEGVGGDGVTVYGVAGVGCLGWGLRFPENNSFVCKISNLHMGFLTMFKCIWVIYTSGMHCEHVTAEARLLSASTSTNTTVTTF